MAYLYDLTDTWNAAGTVFNAIKMNVTNTASAAGSKIVSLQVGSTDKFTVDKDGNGYFSGALQAVGGISIPNLYIGANSGTIGMQDNTASILAYNGTGSGGITNTLRFNTAATERMRIDGSGNVGVGTSSPGRKLDVNGTVRIGGAASLGQAFFSSTYAYDVVSVGCGVTTGYGDSLGLAVLNSTGVMTFATNSTERMRLDSSGNVLIGTTAAVDNNFSLELNAGTSSVRGMGVNNNGGYGVYLTYDNTGRYSTNGAAIRNIANSPLYFETNNTLQATLDTAGNLGLSVTPSAWGGAYKAFQTSGGSVASNSTASMELHQNVYFNGANWIYRTSAAASRFETYSGLFAWLTAPSGTAGAAASFTQAMTLDASGRLLIGTATGVGNDFTSIRFNSAGSYPQGLNMVDSNASANGTTFQVFRKSDDTYIGNIRRNGTDNALLVNGNSYLALGSGDTERMRIDSSGNLLVGTTTSAYSTSGRGLIEVNGSSSAIIAIKTGDTARGYFGASSTLTELSAVGASQPLLFTTNGAERMRIAADGRVGIGSTNPNAELQVYKNSANAPCIIRAQNGSGGNSFDYAGYALDAVDHSAGIVVWGTGSIRAGTMWVQTNTSTPIVFGVGDSEKMRLDTSGNLLVGTTAVPVSGVAGVQITTALGTGLIRIGAGATSPTGVVSFNNPNGEVGLIVVSGTSTSYNTSSDYRLKDIDGPIQNSGAYIDALKPVQGSWKADGSRFIGLIAHEVQEVSETQIATGVKDGEEMQAMDYSAPELIANLIAEIQSLRARVAQLEGN